MTNRGLFLEFLVAALVVSSAAIGAEAQYTGKANSRAAAGVDVPVKGKREVTKISPDRDENSDPSAEYEYEFRKSEFFVRHILVKYDSKGRGQITFERQGEDEAIVEPLEVSVPVLVRMTALWNALNFLNSKETYQSERQYPHLGTIWLTMRQGTQKRVAEFNWTNNPTASSLVSEFRKISDQAILLFDISVARENQPLDTPKLLDQMEGALGRGGMADLQQLATFLRDLTTDERLPLIARNHAGRIIKRIQK